MSGFSADWLALREGADHRSRDTGLAARVAEALAGRDPVRVTDLGSGTGSNLRATAPLLGPKQEWTLVDYDADLLEEAARALTRWADDAQAIGDQLVLAKDGKAIGVRFRIADLNAEAEAVLAAPGDLVTASALFDLISAAWIRRFVGLVANSGAAFYTVLTYNGEDAFNPIHPFDNSVLAAFRMHQKRDKGFGPSAGPDASEVLGNAFREAGYTVATGNSPWILKPSNSGLSLQLLDGIAHAVAETGFVAENGLNDWKTYRHSVLEDKGARVIIGHTDLFARKG